MGLYIIDAPPRTGKTCYMTYKACEIAFDRSRTRLMQQELNSKIENGFTNIKTIPQHCVSASYNITLRKFGYSPRQSRRINPYKLGFANPYVEVHFNIPYECIFIDEAQRYLNSRMSQYYPDWQSRWFEQHGHNFLDIYMATQRFDLIDLNVRRLSKVIEIVEMSVQKDGFGKPCRIIWRLRTFDNSELYDMYISHGRRATELYTESFEVADFNVFNCYDCRSCKPLFYDGHLKQDIDYDLPEITDETFDGYVEYLKKYSDEYQDKFYIKRSCKVA